ncbi:MAG: DUF599 domain-containing protein [Thiobacillaceae bacterium]
MIAFSRIQSWFQEFGVDGIAVIVSLVLVGLYYRYLRARIRRDPTYSIHAVNALARSLWVRNVMTKPGYEVMAVQTLRNFIMVGIMMASTASLLIMGTLTLSGQAENITHSWHAINFIGSHLKELWIIKVMCLLIDFVIAFFAYAMAIRLANQVLFMLNVPQAGQEENPVLRHENVAKRLNQAGYMVAVGMRAFFFAIPLVFWLFGPLFLDLATIGLVIALYRIDRHQAG